MIASPKIGGIIVGIFLFEVLGKIQVAISVAPLIAESNEISVIDGQFCILIVVQLFPVKSISLKYGISLKSRTERLHSAALNDSSCGYDPVMLNNPTLFDTSNLLRYRFSFPMVSEVNLL